jgi:hypothetical protein
MNQRKEVKVVRGKTIIGILVVMGVLIMGTVFAFGYRGPSGTNACQNLDIEKVKQFQKETLSQRDEMMTKKLELKKEYVKDAPDDKRISILKQEIRDLKVSIKQAADKYDVDLRCLKGHHRGKRMGTCRTQ